MPKHPVYIQGTSLFCSGCGHSMRDSIAERQLWCHNQECKFFDERFAHAAVVITARPAVRESEAADAGQAETE